MQDMISTALRYENHQLHLLDQTLLPNKTEWFICDTVDDVYDAILQLKVRGAPLLGLAAVIKLGQLVEQQKPLDEIIQAAKKLRQSRPTAINLMQYIDRFLDVLSHQESNRAKAITEVENIFNEDKVLCHNIAKHGTEIIKNHSKLMTYCNTGSLATAGVGTAIGVINEHCKHYPDTHVYINETRPLLQGGRLTAWELTQQNIQCTLICDNMAAYLMAQGEVDCVLVGADRITANGDFANKIGTYNLAIVADYHQIPFYVVAPYTTLDLETETGEDILIELRDDSEIKGFKSKEQQIIWAPENCSVYNPAFDVTPAELVTGYILDKGVFQAKQLKTL